MSASAQSSAPQSNRRSKRTRSKSHAALQALESQDAFLDDAQAGRGTARRRAATADAPSSAPEAAPAGHGSADEGKGDAVPTASLREDVVKGSTEGTAAAHSLPQPAFLTPALGAGMPMDPPGAPWTSAVVDPSAAGVASALEALTSSQGAPWAPSAEASALEPLTRPGSPSLALDEAPPPAGLPELPAALPSSRQRPVPAVPTPPSTAAAEAGGTTTPSAVDAVETVQRELQRMAQALEDGCNTMLPPLAHAAAMLEQAASLADLHNMVRGAMLSKASAVSGPLAAVLLRQALDDPASVPPTSRLAAAHAAHEAATEDMPVQALQERVLQGSLLPMLSALLGKVQLPEPLTSVMAGAARAVSMQYFQPLVACLHTDTDVGALDPIRVQAMTAALLAWHAGRAVMLSTPPASRTHVAYVTTPCMQLAVLQGLSAAGFAPAMITAVVMMAAMAEGTLDAALGPPNRPGAVSVRLPFQPHLRSGGHRAVLQAVAQGAEAPLEEEVNPNNNAHALRMDCRAARQRTVLRCQHLLRCLLAAQQAGGASAK